MEPPPLIDPKRILPHMLLVPAEEFESVMWHARYQQNMCRAALTLAYQLADRIRAKRVHWGGIGEGNEEQMDNLRLMMNNADRLAGILAWPIMEAASALASALGPKTVQIRCFNRC